MRLLVLFAILLLFVDVCLALQINEVYPNPQGSDNNREFVEVYHEGTVNLTGYTLGDIHGNDTLVGMQWDEGNYSLIVEEGFSYQDINTSVYVIGAAIGNNLGNVEDAVFLYDTELILVDSFLYKETTEGYSWEKNENEWFPSLVINGTPGFINSAISGFNVELNDSNSNETMDPTTSIKTNETDNILINVVRISSLLPDIFYLNQSMSKGFRIDNEASEKINVDLVYSIFFNETFLFNGTRYFENISRYRTKDTLDVFFTEVGNYTICGQVSSDFYEDDTTDNIVCSNVTVIDLSTVSCDRSITLEIDGVLFGNREKIQFKPVISGDYPNIPFIYSYWIEELDGSIVKKMRNSSNTNKKSWTPKIDKPYAGYTLHTRLVDPFCEDINPTNDKSSSYIIVKNHMEEDGAVVLAHIYKGSDGKVKTGESVRAKLYYYTGNLSNKVAAERKLQAFVKDSNGRVVSEITSFAIADSFSSGEIIMPVLLDYTCTSFPIYKEEYNFVVQGFGSSTKLVFDVQGVANGLCAIDSGNGEYHSLVLPKHGQNGTNVTSSITIRNLDTAMHQYKVSSKIYRGPKTYVGDHFANLRIINLDPGVEKTMALTNEIHNLAPGDYKIKIQLERDDRKTIKEFKDDFSVQGSTYVKREEKGTIISFGSLSQEVDTDMKVYGIIKGQGNYTLIFDDTYERENRTIELDGAAKYIFNTSLAPGKNNLVLRLLDEQEVIANEPLILYTADYEVEDITTAKAIIKPAQKNGFELVTGNVIGPVTSYEGTFYRVRSLLNYMIIGILLAFNLFLLFRKAQHI